MPAPGLAPSRRRALLCTAAALAVATLLGVLALWGMGPAGAPHRQLSSLPLPKAAKAAVAAAAGAAVGGHLHPVEQEQPDPSDPELEVPHPPERARPAQPKPEAAEPAEAAEAAEAAKAAQPAQPAEAAEAAEPAEPAQPEFLLPRGFRFNKVVAVIAFDRFEYFRQVIEALRRAGGASDYTLTITIDGPPADATAAGKNGSAGSGSSSSSSDSSSGSGSSAFNRAGWANIVAYSHQLQWLARNAGGGSGSGSSSGGGFRQVLVNASATNLGLWPNKKRAVDGALALSDFAVILEDDIVVAPDALRWFEWHVTSGLIFRRPRLATATCWAAAFPADLGAAVEGPDLLAANTLGLLDKFYFNQWASPWGWATWRRTWDAVGANWTGQDLDLARRVVAQGWGESMPLVARCNNIGSVGVHKRGAGVGHIQARAITSSSFPARRRQRCAYTELPRANLSAPLQTEEVHRHVRQGIFLDRRFANTSLAQLQRSMQRFVAAHPRPALWRSSC